MADFKPYKVNSLPTSNIDVNGIYYVKTGNTFKSYIRNQADTDWVEQEVGDTFTFEDLTPAQKEELKGDVIAYNSLDEADKDDLASRVPITGVVEEGNTQAVSGGEVYSTIQQKRGTYQEAYDYSLDNNIFFTWFLEDVYEDISIKKIIYHTGNNVFVDAFGATVELDIDPSYSHNFKYTVKLTDNNQQIYVPVSPLSIDYDMIVDWGDGVKTPFTGAGVLKSCSHIYTGVIGDEFQITISGNCPRLLFGTLAEFPEKDTLLSIDNNTLEGTMLNMTLNDLPNLEYICANAFQNFTTESPLELNFKLCTSLHTIEEGFGSYLSGKNVTTVSFRGTNISVLEDSFFQHILGLDTASQMFRDTPLTSVPSSLRGALTNVTSIYYMFQGIDAPLNIPSDLFDLVAGAQITDFRSAFAGTTVNPSPITGDAKALYDVLVTKAAESPQTSQAFSHNAMTNKNQVPTSWGGTLTE